MPKLLKRGEQSEPGIGSANENRNKKFVFPRESLEHRSIPALRSRHECWITVSSGVFFRVTEKNKHYFTVASRNVIVSCLALRETHMFDLFDCFCLC